jgi:hypothetical protein
MTRPLTVLLMAAVLLWLPLVASSKGSDGFVILHGRIEEANANGDAVNFQFTGEFFFTILTAMPDDPGSQKLEQEFKVTRLPVRIPWWKPNPVPGVEGPYVVNFENASRHAMHASRTVESVTIVLFRPIISYDIYGVMTLVGFTHAQVMPDRGPPVAH